MNTLSWRNFSRATLGSVVLLAYCAAAGRARAQGTADAGKGPRGVNLSLDYAPANAAAEEALKNPATPFDRTVGAADRIAVFIELEGEPAALAFARRKESAQRQGLANAEAAGIAAGRTQFDLNRAAQEALAAAFLQPETAAEPIYFARRAINGIAVFTAPGRVEALRKLPGVRRVTALSPHEFTSTRGTAFIGSPQFWQATGLTGAGTTIAVVDLGIDYTHTMFGGSGSVADYNANDPFVIGDIPGFPSAKIIGGVDLAGDNYTYLSIPEPDPDPMDCVAHGTAVSGVAAGFGVLPDGSTYPGPYDASAETTAFRIQPGVAPEARIFAIKIGGCINATESYLVAQGIDRALDFNDDGNMSDRADVINLSVARSYGGDTEPDTIAANNAALAGVIPVSASANDGDFFYVLGSPGSAARVITAAGTHDDGIFLIHLGVNSPPSAVADYVVAPAAIGPAITPAGITGDLAYETNLDACSPFPNPAIYAGKIAFIDVDPCSGELQAFHAQQTGAIAVIVATEQPYPYSVTGLLDFTIPVATAGSAAAQALRDALLLGPVNVTISSASTYPQLQLADTSAAFTSRGPSKRGSALKPDLSAPSVEIVFAKFGSGDKGTYSSGTSFGAPHTAGAAALARELHPDWTVEEIKALIINTAIHDVFNDVAGSSPTNYVSLAGAGRIDVEEMGEATAIAYSVDDPGAVNISFGAPEILHPSEFTRTVRVVNKGSEAVSFTAGEARVTTPPGIGFSIEAPASIDLAPGASADFIVRMTADPALMKHVPDPNLDLVPGGFYRHYLTEMSGFIELVSPTHGTLRVPVHAAPRHAGFMLSTEDDFEMPSAPGSFALPLSGVEVNEGILRPEETIGLVYPLELQYSAGPALTAVPAADEFLHVGVRRTTFDPGGIANTTLVFGFAMRDAWAHPFDTYVRIFIDPDEDGTDDFSVVMLAPGSLWDSTHTYVEDLDSHNVVLQFPINGWGAQEFDSATMNSDVRVMLARAADIGLSDANPRFNYRMEAILRENEFATTISTPTLSYDALAPGFDFTFQAYFDTDGNFIDVAANPAAFAANGSLGLLLLHHHNIEGFRAEALLPHQNAARGWEMFK